MNIKKILCKMLGCDRLSVDINLFYNQKPTTNNMIKLSDSQQVTGTLGTPKNRKGHDAPVEAGSVSYSSDTSVATVTKNPDNEMEFTVKAVAPGVCRIDVTADADTGEGVSNISTFFGVEVTPGMAVGFGEPSFGTPEEQPVVEGPQHGEDPVDPNELPTEPKEL